MDNKEAMRQITPVFIALIVLCGIMSAVAAEAPVLKDKLADKAESSETALITTPSMAAFLNDSWTPNTFSALLASQATSKQREMTRNNTTMNSSTYSIYDFLNDSYSSPAVTSPIYTANAAGKDKTIAWTGESIYQFLNEGWTPSKPIETFPQTPFKQHQMN